ncbi:hydroxyacid dehydrogenase [Streptomyces sp. H10-C2]|uniref:hydroxyacid dehydrogenase n=1 Tax=unclassified Streptomyces TaxID=2593676 RepID=UPI0024BAA5A2|nr:MULTISPECIES: hydroxyacid dehydrogenase [unclassified Streptomyces]MDJ0345126.1 hydroxyacid dehydrogenase [Streptomyces sp. PH10-H1]MDJ0374031.1 hydroxyacid dehydrogenase [Streptomyces sp. H10-C2]
MADRPTAVLAMRADVVDAVLPADLRARLENCVRLHPDLLTSGFGTPAARAALGAADLLITGWGCSPIDADVLAAAPRLGAVVHAAGTVKHHVHPAVWQRGITVSSAADANAGPVIEFTLATIVLAARRTLGTAAQYARGDVPGFGERQGGDGATIGVIGASRIGRGVIARLAPAPAGYRILLADPYVSPATAAELGVQLMELDDLCRASDIVTVHAPDLPETHQLLDARRLALLRDGSTLINTARGRLIDTDALVRECATGRLDAYLDVSEPEPLPHGHPLLGLPNVLVTPHIAGCQGSEIRRLGAYAVDEVERWTRGGRLLGEVSAADLARIA